ncbi:hypothetical protein Ga0061061_1167 [Chelatococcus sambhunathii]|uniref:Uncharacterized protein n=1 Tax=Chelatococcus sambhunathii TaxID=363953 RepID=A0ABM9U9R7_9HYPH|nr:hypothetical protein [Chelatococcus sambhunathii]CUA90842.1 hypothetical protein Ga0061061_1167 [Chelatococcus sambhunathii]
MRPDHRANAALAADVLEIMRRHAPAILSAVPLQDPDRRQIAANTMMLGACAAALRHHIEHDVDMSTADRDAAFKVAVAITAERAFDIDADDCPIAEIG